MSRKLSFSKYFKPTNTFAYLLNTSNHQTHICKNIPFGLFYSIRRACSNLIDYFFKSRKIFLHLLLRGYNYHLLSKISNTIAFLNRDDLIPYNTDKMQKDQNMSNSLIIKLPFDLNLNDKSLELKETFLNIAKNNVKLNNYKLHILYTKQCSIKDLFINNFKLYKACFSFKKCFKNVLTNSV